ncbi:transcription termination factor NusA [Candidatus Collierbacteria bacterium RIFOXYB1_FULL_49_13]|uniref:Transcription termination/antitermination protein NusA n=1 Tax=Candidatus Collierbacteria bacterium RIFOXYB1_FULL_49_13 TaxID=1817728 RepID=A0A1F5FKN2_9BACT|nr:MAG: transcription termination factor NusA [Candidatus Collierbacteria bacterium RIFOXYB1_FULL_49_13]
MSDANKIRTGFAATLHQICTERGISAEAVLESINTALLTAYRKDYATEYDQLEADGKVVVAHIDPESGEYKIKAGDPEADLSTYKDVTPPFFGRIAAQAAKQVVLQQVREAEKTAILTEYRDRIGELITAQILRLDGKNIILDIGRGQGVMPPEEQIRGEYYRLNSRIAVIIADIRETFKGETVIVSRSDERLVKELFAREVPEVGTGVVTIKSLAREAGVRTKLAVESTQDGVDPVGSCVGQKGVRVQAVINELNGERVDIIPFNPDPAKFLKSSLSPADNLEIEFVTAGDKKVANITVPDDQLSLAIGRGGQNVRLAAKLTGYHINIVSSETKKTASATGEEEYEIDLLNLDTKVRGKLIDASITRLDQLLGDNISRLQELKGIGPKTVDAIKKALDAYQTASATAEK